MRCTSNSAEMLLLLSIYIPYQLTVESKLEQRLMLHLRAKDLLQNKVRLGQKNRYWYVAES